MYTTNSRYLKQFYDSLNDEYKYTLKWKIHDTLGRLGSLEDTFTQVYVYDLKENHHYDHHNKFWDRSRHLNNNSRCLKGVVTSPKTTIKLLLFRIARSQAWPP